MERQQLLGRVYSAHVQSVPGTVFTKIFLVGLPIIQISIGVVYRSDCPQQPYIPTYMIVAGVFGLLLGLFSHLSCVNPEEHGVYYIFPYLCLLLNTLVSLFLFCWLIAGSVWVYSIYPANYNKTASGAHYCNKTLYLSAFWITTLVYILIAGPFALCVIFTCCCSKEENTRRENA